jgi:hypothetical protein
MGGEAIAAARRPALRSRALRESLAVFGWTRLLVLVVAVVASAVLTHQPRDELSFDSPALTHPVAPFLLSPLARWDAVWFLRVAAHGYGGANVTFFPLYPLLVRVAAGGSGSPAALLVASYLVSLASFAGALYLLHRLVMLELGPEHARPALLTLALFPAALFFGAPFSESLFLLLSVAVFYAARRGRFDWAGVAAGLASATRAAGIALVVPLAILWWRSRPRRRSDLAFVALAPAGVVAYSIYLAAEVGDGLAWIHAEKLWGRSVEGPFAGVVSGTRAAFHGATKLLSGGPDPFSIAAHDLQNWAFLLFAAIAIAGAVRRLPAPYWTYAIALLALPLSSPVRGEPLQSLPRYVATAFPLFMWMALACATPRRRTVVLCTSTALLVVCTARFASWHWFA